MFEDSQNQNAPQNLPAEPQDMFADVEKNSLAEKTMEEPLPDALSSGLLKKKDRVTVPPNLPPLEEGANFGNYKMSSPILGKILLFLLIILLLGGLAYGGWWFLSRRKSNVQTPAQNTQTNQNNNSQNQTATNSSGNLPNQTNNDEILFGQGVDLDKDGLDDVREKEIGTNPQNADSDGDDLSDGDEVIIYKSNPLSADSDSDDLSDGDEVLIWKTNLLNPDSDADTYPDGTEVKNGYSPLGPGKLFNVPATQATSSINTSTSTATSTI
jgi:hypothetical protein